MATDAVTIPAMAAQVDGSAKAADIFVWKDIGSILLSSLLDIIESKPCAGGRWV